MHGHKSRPSPTGVLFGAALSFGIIVWVNRSGESLGRRIVPTAPRSTHPYFLTPTDLSAALPLFSPLPCPEFRVFWAFQDTRP